MSRRKILSLGFGALLLLLFMLFSKQGTVSEVSISDESSQNLEESNEEFLSEPTVDSTSDVNNANSEVVPTRSESEIEDETEEMDETDAPWSYPADKTAND